LSEIGDGAEKSDFNFLLLGIVKLGTESKVTNKATFSLSTKCLMGSAE
jgi:hypothetical protein